MEKMTIHRALAELKLTDSKIEKQIETLQPVGMKQKDGRVNAHYEMDDFKSNAESKLQSITDLIDRKVKLKNAIVEANGKTFVTIDEKKMTIADAINYKKFIDHKKDLLHHLESTLREFKSQIAKQNERVEQNALKLAEAALQKDNVKITDTDAVAVTQPYMDKNMFELVDPVNAQEQIDKLTEEIGNFEAEVDAVLSEANALTIIEI